MLPLKPICERRFVRRDGTSIIYIQYCYSAEKRTLLNTEIAIPPAYWNKKTLSISKDLPIIFGDCNELNKELKRMMRLAEDIIDFAIQKSIVNRGEFTKQSFSPHFDSATLKDEQKVVQIVAVNSHTVNLDIFYQIDEYIKGKEKKVSPETIGVFRQMKEHLLAFQSFRKKHVSFESLDYNFYQSFVEFLTFEYVQKRHKEERKGLKVITIGKAIKQLRIFVKDRALITFSILHLTHYKPLYQADFLPKLEIIAAVYEGRQLARLEKCKQARYSNLALVLLFYVWDKTSCLDTLNSSDGLSKLLTKVYEVDNGSLKRNQIQSVKRQRYHSFFLMDNLCLT